MEAMRSGIVVVVAAACALGACATGRTNCPAGTTLARRIYSGGAEAEYCRRPDGVRQGPETRYYESGAEHVSGEFVDGAQSGVWRFRFSNGRNWRAERWDDGALVAKTVDPAVARLSPEQIEALGPTSSNIIKLASHDPRTYREARERGGGTFAVSWENGRPRVVGDYDADGLRVGVWHFWNEDGKLAREVEYLAGIREHAAREWHPNGAPAAEGRYLAGAREGSWRFWDDRGQLTAEILYRNGTPAVPVAPVPGGPLPERGTSGGMLPATP